MDEDDGPDVYKDLDATETVAFAKWSIHEAYLASREWTDEATYAELEHAASNLERALNLVWRRQGAIMVESEKKKGR